MYIGDSISVSKRIRKNHCAGSVKTSAFRRSIAAKMGFPITTEPTTSKKGKIYSKIYINLPNRLEAEQQISTYVTGGRWKFIRCISKEEAQDFQYYAIEKINPVLNRDRHGWNHERERQYAELLSALLNCPWCIHTDERIYDGPGVYLHGNLILI